MFFILFHFTGARKGTVTLILLPKNGRHNFRVSNCLVHSFPCDRNL